MQRIVYSLVAAILIEMPVARAQFNSGSDGSDGAMNYTTPGTIIFNPAADFPNHPAGSTIFNFTTINIGTGVTLKLSPAYLNGPVYFLAQGAVTINGTLDLNGEDGAIYSPIPANRRAGAPGAGGFGGGVSGRFSSDPSINAKAVPGSGPAGGVEGTGPVTCPPYGNGQGGGFTANRFLVPLIGGSGGGGGILNGNSLGSSYGSSGGGGGGAILIASSTSIILNGVITANGGKGGDPGPSCADSRLGAGGGGAGGAIRLAAPTINGNGVIYTLGGNGMNPGANGLTRIEAFQYGGTLSIAVPAAYGSPFNPFVPTGPPPSLRVVSVAGNPVQLPPTGSFTMPDVQINSSNPVPFAIEAHGIPNGTTVTLRIFSENGPDLPPQTATLQGSLDLSTATISVQLPSGFSRGFVRATWTQ